MAAPSALARALTGRNHIRTALPRELFSFRRCFLTSSGINSKYHNGHRRLSWPRPVLRAYQHRSIQTTPQRQGLYSIPNLLEPSDFLKTAQEAMSTCDSLASSFDSTPQPQTRHQAMEILFRLDEISRVVCNVIDAAELCRNSHVDEAWRIAANQAFTVLSDYIARLNANVSLYKALRSVTDSKDLFQQLADAEQRFALLLQTEFERDGIHLSQERRNEVRGIQGSIVELEGQFHRNLVEYHRTFGALRSDVEAVIPSHVLQQVFGTPLGESDSTIELPSEQQILQTLQKHSPSPSLRKQVHTEYCTGVPENLDVLQELRIERHKLAQVLGFESYAERVLADNKMARSTADVAQFLNSTAKHNKPLFDQEMDLLSRAKQQLEGNGDVEAWDVSYLQGLLKQQLGFHSGELAQYLTLARCLESIEVLCKSLFGIVMVEEEILPDDRWDGTKGDEDGRVRRFSFHEESTGQPLGTMYLDLHPRQGKYGHAAHFTVRCGCVVDGSSISSGNQNEDDLTYQLPVVALVCNLSSGGTLEGPGVLTHSEVETLFHEMGHALHSLLSKTKFQHVSGTRAAMDFVETPSHLLENYVWDPTFLKILAVNPHSGEPISDEIIAKLVQSRFQFQAIERRTQILYAKFDQELFGKPVGDESVFFSRDSSIDMFSSLYGSMGIPYAQGTHWHSRFGHLVSYGAGYYSYLYAQEFAKAIWESKFQGNSLNHAAGKDLWHKLLRHGGSKDPQAMILDLLRG